MTATQPQAAALVAATAPLRAALDDLDLRLVARPGRVVVEGLARGSRLASVIWTDYDHQAALTAAASPAEVDAGWRGERLGDALVLERRAALPAEAWERHGTLPALGASLLNMALRRGLNVVVAGSGGTPRALAWALVDRGRQPATVRGGPAVPEGWAQVPTVAAARRLSPDRVALVDLPPRASARALAGLAGAVAVIAATRFDHLLMRYELAAPPSRAPAGLQVLAGAHWLVLVEQRGGLPQVCGIAEVLLHADGYRPQVVLERAGSGAAEPLVPRAVPSFWATGVDPSEEAVAAAFVATEDAAAAEVTHVGPLPARRPAGRADLYHGAAVGGGGEAGEAAPGWELDRLGARASVPHAADADLIATQGLEPPPTPGRRS